jgi:hypothetical protein
MSSAQMSHDIATAAPTTTRRTNMPATSYEAAERAVDWLSDRGQMAPGGPTSTRKATVRR